GRLTLTVEGNAIAGSLEGLVPDSANRSVTVVLRYPYPQKPATVEVKGLLFPYDPLHITLFDVREQGQVIREDFFNKDQPVVNVSLSEKRKVFEVIHRFTGAGIHHIFIGPDHILFILGLLLLGGSVGRLLKIVTSFTLAHSITLTLATLDIVNPPAKLIEPLIALSIVYVGLDNLRASAGRRDPRALLAFCFGFVHGFGFASVLKQFGLPSAQVGWALFAFNFGVEIGQACIVGIAAPLLALLRARLPRQAPRVVQVGSIAIALAGAWWFVQRTFLST
ncbi:MAG TPA: HupE/UreJ family protein, partial [bacterium]|nr:HupE/UreJ family protein [bacterium]